MSMDPVVRAHYDAGVGLQAVSLSPDQKYAALACRTHVQVVHLRNGNSESQSSVEGQGGAGAGAGSGAGSGSGAGAISPMLQLQLSQAGNGGVGNFTMTDVAWSPLDVNRIAASATNGAIAVFNLQPKGFPSSLQQSINISQGRPVLSAGQKNYGGNHIEWEADAQLSTRAVNRIGWHPSERDTLLSANQDGMVRIFDTRSGNSNTISFNAQADACRDAQFNPFYGNILASVHESGNVAIWDRRMPDQALTRLAAHTESGLSLDWNPTQAWLLATGSRDKTVKIWDLASIPAIASTALFEDSSTSTIKKSSNSRFVSRNSSLAFTANSSSQQPAGSAASGGVNSSGVKHRPRCVLHTSSNVGRVAWRPKPLTQGALLKNSLSPPSSVNQRPPSDYKESTTQGLSYLSGTNVSTQLASTSSAERGEICIWDISRSTNMPACLLRGHSEGCTGFAWLETLSLLSGTDRSPAKYSTSSIKHVSSFRNQSREGSIHNSKSSPMLSLAENFMPMAHSKSGTDSKAAKNQNTTDEVVLHRSGIFQHLFTIGKDGNVLVQDVRNAYFPGEHISRHVVAFSAMGHLAYQRGNIIRGDPLSLIANEVTQQSPGWFKDQPSAFGVKIIDVSPSASVSPDANENDKKLAQEGEGDYHQHKAKLMDHIQEGVITMGMSDFSHLAASLDTMGTGAEGGAYDPTVIKHLADHYIYVHPIPHMKPTCNSCLLHGYSDKIAHAVKQAIMACQSNGQVASAIGLAGHAATWSAMESLLPSLVSISQSEQKKHIDISGDIAHSTEIKNTPPSDLNAPRQEHSQLPLDLLPSSTSPSHSWELLFTIEITGDLLVDMLETGDCQHFVILCEVIRAIDDGTTLKLVTQKFVSDLRIREGYMSYLDTLDRLRLFSHANALISTSTDRYISQLSKSGVIMRACCAKCGKEVGDNDVQTAVGSVWCGKCKRCAGLCVLCQKPVTRLLQWCPICGHGGHSACLQQWFAENLVCPSGCGHRCTMKCH